MSRIKELAEIIDEAREICLWLMEAGERFQNIGRSSLHIIGAVKNIFSIPDTETEAIEQKPEKKEEKPAISREDVRKVLVRVSNSGHREEIKALLVKHGADNLTKLDESEYASVIEEAEAIGNG